MAYSLKDATDFYLLFRGNDNAYGTTEVGEIVDGKAKSSSKLVYDTPSQAVIIRHLNGEQSIGISPIDDNSECYFGAIDIDDYDYDIMDIVDAIEDFHLPLCPCFSKSKKLHIYVFFTDPAPAEKVQELLQWYATAFFCKPKTEIFPKQASTTNNNKFYSWINLPYFKADDVDNHRKMIGKGGTLYSLEKAVKYMMYRRKSIEEHFEFLKTIPFNDAPPCVLSGILLRDIGPGQRNNWLFSVGVYLRLKDENCDLNVELTAVNKSLKDPIGDDELQNTILKGFQRKSYFYMCSALERCNKSLCKKSVYGIESKESTGLDYGELTQVMTDPPYYEWLVNGQKLIFYSETEMLQQTRFRALCMRQLHLVPRRVKDDRWSAILTRACENIVVIEQTMDEYDFTTGSTFLDLTYMFFNAHRRAENMTQLTLGRVFKDESCNEYVFTAKSFIDFLRNKNDLKSMSTIEMRTRLQSLGAYKNGTVWRISCANIPENIKQIDIDFDKGLEDDTDF